MNYVTGDFRLLCAWCNIEMRAPKNEEKLEVVPYPTGSAAVVRPRWVCPRTVSYISGHQASENSSLPARRAASV